MTDLRLPGAAAEAVERALVGALEVFEPGRVHHPRRHQPLGNIKRDLVSALSLLAAARSEPVPDHEIRVGPSEEDRWAIYGLKPDMTPIAAPPPEAPPARPVQRWNLTSRTGFPSMLETEAGPWVRYADIAPYLAPGPREDTARPVIGPWGVTLPESEKRLLWEAIEAHTKAKTWDDRTSAAIVIGCRMDDLVRAALGCAQEGEGA